MEIAYGPIKAWPGQLRSRSERIAAPFKSSFSDTLQQLNRELRMVNAESAVVQLAMPHFRRDGLPYADAIAEHPGVILSFVKGVKNKVGQRIRVPLSFPADRFTKWESNLRAITIALEDLRRIDRYSVTQNSEQYLGFKALPPPGPSHESILTVDEAARWLADSFGKGGPPWSQVLTSADSYRMVYRDVAFKSHPDRSGDPEQWAKLQGAKSLLDQHHGI
ncbi:MAG TPA: hypothetical protein VGN72_05035 [Tepidisphaeraceae bacterium]|nr:hypothetical protein [Tepidisphaeraceae bacterium]